MDVYITCMCVYVYATCYIYINDFVHLYVCNLDSRIYAYVSECQRCSEVPSQIQTYIHIRGSRWTLGGDDFVHTDLSDNGIKESS